MSSNQRSLLIGQKNQIQQTQNATRRDPEFIKKSKTYLPLSEKQRIRAPERE